MKSVCISRETLIMYNYLITKKFIDLKSSKNSVGWGIRIFLSSRYNGNRTHSDTKRSSTTCVDAVNGSQSAIVPKRKAKWIAVRSVRTADARCGGD